MSVLISNLLGWAGMILILLAYFLISTNKVGGGSKLYQTLNFFGGVGIVISTYFTKSYPAMTLNLIWALIAIATLYKITKGENENS